MTLKELYDLLAQLKQVIGGDAQVCIAWGDEEEAKVQWRAEPGKLVLF